MKWYTFDKIVISFISLGQLEGIIDAIFWKHEDGWFELFGCTCMILFYYILRKVWADSIDRIFKG